MAFVWKFKECFRRRTRFRIFAVRWEPRDGIKYKRGPAGIPLESLFDKYDCIITFPGVLVIFRPLGVKFRKRSLP